MVQDGGGKTCEWRADGADQPRCGKPAISQGEGTWRTRSGELYPYSMDLCPEHINEQGGRSTAADPG